MKKFFWTSITLLLLVVLGFNIYYNLLKIGIVLRESSAVLEYAFYALSLILCYALILHPMFQILFAPAYSVNKVSLDKKVSYSFLKRLGTSIYKSKTLSEEDAKDLLEVLNAKGKGKKERLANKLFILYNNQIKDIITKMIEESAKNTLYCTAISQNGFVDSMVVLVNNFRMVKNIVKLCGFRPHFIRTMKLFLNIFTSSLIADGAQNINISAIFGAGIGSGLKIIANSVANGILNAFFMLRTGLITIEYIYTDDVKKKKSSLLSSCMLKASLMLPKLITEVLTDPIKNLGKAIFKPSKPTTYENDEGDLMIDLNQKWYKPKK